jgi:hypothetical protein
MFLILLINLVLLCYISFSILNPNAEAIPTDKELLNNPPNAYDMVITSDIHDVIGFVLNASDPDKDNNLNFSILAKPARGQIVSFDSNSGSVVYSPDILITASISEERDSFIFRVTDSKGSISKPAVVTLKYLKIESKSN